MAVAGRLHNESHGTAHELGLELGRMLNIWKQKAHDELDDGFVPLKLPVADDEQPLQAENGLLADKEELLAQAAQLKDGPPAMKADSATNEKVYQLLFIATPLTALVELASLKICLRNEPHNILENKQRAQNLWL